MAVNPRPRRAAAQRGFSLLELLLTVGVAATLLIFVIQMGQAVARDQAIRAAANYVAQIDKALDVMINYPERFNDIYANVVAAGGRAEVTIPQLLNGTGVLPVSPLLPASFPNPGPFAQTYRVILRVADNMADPNDNPSLEVLVASQNLVDDEASTRIAALIGGSGGALRDTPAASTGTIRGVYGTWAVPMTTLNGSLWHTTVTAATPAPTTDNGGYVVSYHYFDLNRLARDYLYRTDLGDSELNTMHADLSLGNYNLIGADDVQVTGALTANEMAVRGPATVNTMTIGGKLQSDGPAQMGTVTTAGGSTSRLSSPNGVMTVSGNIAANGAVFNNSLNTVTFGGTGGASTSSGAVTAESGIHNGAILVNGAQGIHASPVPTAGLQVSGNTTIGGSLKATTLNTGTLTVGTGNVGTVYLQTNGGNYQQSGGAMTVSDRLSIGGTARVTSFGACGNGC